MPDGIKDALLIYNPTSGGGDIAVSRKSNRPRVSEGRGHRHGTCAHDGPRAAQRWRGRPWSNGAAW